MLDLDLPFFPFDSSAITVTTTVWVGVCVAVFFNLRLGWTLSGLVVPGYLVPLLITRPITAAVIFAESILTYLIVLAISELPRRLPYWSSLFGRDRFFMILVVSVIVRAGLDGWLLPYVGRIAVEQYGVNFDYRNNFHSFGLIVVALIANYFWKPGVLRGILPLLTCVGITYALIQWVFVGLTNFNVGNLHLLYDDISTSLLSNPKSYIIVLTTAFLASWFNLRYAWDFNGILIPALLGLLWHEPSKILFSGAEALLILTISSWLLKAPMFRQMTIEGGRKLCFFFSVCFAYRLACCHLLPLLIPDVVLSDSFGFGYLLTTLVAIKMHDKHLGIRLFRSTVEVSALGAVAGSFVGYAFYCGPDIRFDWFLSQPTASTDSICDSVQSSSESLSSLIRADKTLLYEKMRPDSYLPPMQFELNTFHDAVKRLCCPGVIDNPSGLGQIAASLESINYQLVLVRERYFYLRERTPANGWGMYVIDTQSTDGLCIEIPAPLDEFSTMESGLCLFQNFSSCALAVAGAPRRINLSGDADVTRTKSSIFSEFHRVCGQSNVLQIRGFENSGHRRVSQVALPGRGSEQSMIASQLWIRGTIPAPLKLSQLKQLVGSYDVLWNESPVPNQLRRHTTGSFTELVLNVNDRRQLIGKLFQNTPAAAPEAATGSASNDPPQNLSVEIIHRNFHDWMSERKSEICQQGTNAYQPARIEQMLYMDREVASPLIKLLDQSGSDSVDTIPCWQDEVFLGRLLPIHAAATAIGYQVAVIVDSSTQEPRVALFEQEHTATGRSRGWGTFVFRPGLRQAYVVEIPRPLFERRSFDFGANLFDRPKACAILIAGAHPRANLDGSADISNVANKTNLFNLVRHALLRHLNERPLLIVQARAIQAPVDADVVVATDDGAHCLAQLTPLKKQFLEQLHQDRLSTAFVNGNPETAGYELGILMQAMSVQISRHKEVISLWLSPSLRMKFQEQSDNHTLVGQFEACGISTIQSGLGNYLTQRQWEHDGNLPENLKTDPLPDELKQQLRSYADNFDVLKLLDLTRRHRDWNFQPLIDGDSGQAFLLISKRSTEFPTVMNLTGFVGDHSMEIDRVNAVQIDEYIRSRTLWLQLGTGSTLSTTLQNSSAETGAWQ